MEIVLHVPKNLEDNNISPNVIKFLIWVKNAKYCFHSFNSVKKHPVLKMDRKTTKFYTTMYT